MTEAAPRFASGRSVRPAVLGGWQIADADGVQGWQAYNAGEEESTIRKRRERSKDFWID
jgi:hypothetical protein